MVKLKSIITEILNTYIVQAYILTDTTYNITDVLDQIRAVRKITIVSNITPDDYPQLPDTETTKVRIKFVTRGEAQIDIDKFKEDMLTSDLSKTDLRIPGVKSLVFKTETLSRL